MRDVLSLESAIAKWCGADWANAESLVETRINAYVKMNTQHLCDQ
jgi:hypothetical protein